MIERRFSSVRFGVTFIIPPISRCKLFNAPGNNSSSGSRELISELEDDDRFGWDNGGEKVSAEVLGEQLGFYTGVSYGHETISYHGGKGMDLSVYQAEATWSFLDNTSVTYEIEDANGTGSNLDDVASLALDILGTTGDPRISVAVSTIKILKSAYDVIKKRMPSDPPNDSAKVVVRGYYKKILNVPNSTPTFINTANTVIENRVGSDTNGFNANGETSMDVGDTLYVIVTMSSRVVATSSDGGTSRVYARVKLEGSSGFNAYVDSTER